MAVNQAKGGSADEGALTSFLKYVGQLFADPDQVARGAGEFERLFCNELEILHDSVRSRGGGCEVIGMSICTYGNQSAGMVNGLRADLGNAPLAVNRHFHKMACTLVAAKGFSTLRLAAGFSVSVDNKQVDPNMPSIKISLIKRVHRIAQVEKVKVLIRDRAPGLRDITVQMHELPITFGKTGQYPIDSTHVAEEHFRLIAHEGSIALVNISGTGIWLDSSEQSLLRDMPIPVTDLLNRRLYIGGAFSHPFGRDPGRIALVELTG